MAAHFKVHTPPPFHIHLSAEFNYIVLDSPTFSMALCKRAFRLCSNPRLFCLANCRAVASLQPPTTPSSTSSRPLSQGLNPNGNLAFLVDTLSLVRSLEAHGIPSKQAEAITSAITEVFNDTMENCARSFVTKSNMQQVEMLHDSKLSRFKSEMQGLQEHHFSLLQRETEKLRNDIEKMRSELRYEIDKVTAGQRLDMNLERGRMRDELTIHKDETTNLAHRLDREVQASKARVEAAKYDVIRYCIGTLVSISAVSLAVLRIML